MGFFLLTWMATVSVVTSLLTALAKTFLTWDNPGRNSGFLASNPSMQVITGAGKSGRKVEMEGASKCAALMDATTAGDSSAKGNFLVSA
jgi:hypothetical protein